MKKVKKEITMETMIAYCGIICSECPVYLATQADDDKAREDVANCGQYSTALT
jgi:hypothetical protein